MSINRQYTQELRDETNYSATWLPIVRVAPGDVGRITNYEYQPLTNLKALGIPFEVEAGHTQADFDYYSAGSVSINSKAAGESPALGSAIAQADAGITIKFGRAKAVVFRAAGCTSAQIKERAALENEILARYQANVWPEDQVVIMEVVSAASATILISNESNAQIELLAKGAVGVQGLDLASVDANFKVLRESNIATKILATERLTPLFKAAAIRKRLFRPTTFREAPGGDRSGIALAGVDYDDFARE